MVDYIRLYAPTDASPIGKIALEYTKALLRIAPVRVISVSGPGAYAGPWSGFQSLSAVVTKGKTETFINAVCAPPDRWTFWNRIQMPNRDGSFETASERVELWTQGVRNLLFACAEPAGSDQDVQIETAKRYDAVITPTADLSAWWLPRGVMAAVIQVPVPSATGEHTHKALRSLVLGEPSP